MYLQAQLLAEIFNFEGKQKSSFKAQPVITEGIQIVYFCRAYSRVGEGSIKRKAGGREKV